MIRRSLTYTFSLALILSLFALASSASAQPAAPAAPSAAAAPPPQESTNEENVKAEIEDIEKAAEPPKIQSSIFESGQIVRRRLLYRSTRFEIAPFFGVSMNDAFNRALLPGIDLNYHLTNELGINASFGYGVAQWNTDLKNNFLEAFKEPGLRTIQCKTVGEKECISFAKTQLFATLGLSYVPFYGKFILFNSFTVQWDFHLVAGAAIIKQEAYTVTPKTQGKKTTFTEKAVPDSQKSVLAGIKPGGAITAGIRFYLNDFMSLNLDLRNLIYSTKDYTVGNNSNTSISDRMIFSLGLSFFLPTNLKVSW